LLSVEQEEAKRIATEVNIAERKRAMDVCAKLGFTLENVEGIAEIVPKALGMKGQEVDFSAIEIGDRPSKLKVKDEKVAAKMKAKPKSNRVDLGKAPEESKTILISTEGGAGPGGLDNDYVGFEFGEDNFEGAEFEGGLSFNHKLRRKLHRAIEAAQIKKELLVREKAKEFCESSGIEVPIELAVPYAPVKLTGRRILEDGTVETEKQERVRKRLELAEYNKAAKVLRAQAKAEAIEAGLRVFAELTGKNPIEGGNEGSESADDVTTMIGAQLEVQAEEEASKKGGSSKKRRRSNEEVDVKGGKKSKKSKKFADPEDIEMTEAPIVVEKKSKKSKHSKIAESEETKNSVTDELTLKKSIQGSADEEGVEDSARKEKKQLKKEKKARKVVKEAELKDDDQETAVEPLVKKSKKKKHMESSEVATPTVVEEKAIKKDKKNKPKTVEVEVEAAKRPATSGADQWNPDALTGGVARKDKFLRLLGAGKANVNKEAGKSSKKDISSKKSFVSIAAVESELERQFEAGVRMKHDGQGKRRGLGA
jgi:hypothetical protein